MSRINIFGLLMEGKLKAVFILGPTASGKTRLAARIARLFGGEIISADSRQVYRGMDIGTGKDLAEYVQDGLPVPCHLIDIAEPGDEYNLSRFCTDFKEALLGVAARGRLPVAVGGSAMYISAVLNEYELPGGPPIPELREELADKTNADIAAMIGKLAETENASGVDVNNRNRLVRTLERLSSPGSGRAPAPLNADWLLIGTYLPRTEIHRRIQARLEERLGAGMIEEVRRLHDKGLPWEKIEYFGLEYRACALLLQGKIGLEEMKSQLLAKIRQFARRQDIWFRKLERQGWKIFWIRPDDYTKAGRLISDFLKGDPLNDPDIRISETFYGKKSFRKRA